MEKIAENLYMLGNAALPAFLVLGAEKSVLIDAGMAYMAPKYVEETNEVIKSGVGPTYLLFTHAHFDHIGGAPHLANRFPEMEMCGHSYLFDILKRDKARVSISHLNKTMAERFAPGNDLVESDFDFSVIKGGKILNDGDTIDLGGGITIEVIETPGHTNDSLSYFIPHIKAVATGEAIGIPHGSDLYVSSEFLSSFDDYIASIKRVQKKRPEILLLGHQTNIHKEDIDRYFHNAVKSAFELKEKIIRYIKDDNMDVETAVETIKEEEYIPLREGKQPEEAYLLNLRAQVKFIAGELTRN